MSILQGVVTITTSVSRRIGNLNGHHCNKYTFNNKITDLNFFLPENIF